MESSTKIRWYIFALTALAFIAITLIITVAYVGASKLTKSSEYMADVWQSSRELQQIQVLIEKTEVRIRDLAMNTDPSTKENIIAQLNDTVHELGERLNSYRNYRYMAEYNFSLEHEYALIDELEQLMQDYREVIMSIIEISLENDTEKMNAVISDNKNILNPIRGKLQELSDFDYDQSLQLSYYLQDSSYSAMVRLITCSVIAFVILIIASNFVKFAAMKIFEDERKVKENLPVPDKIGNNNDTSLLISELSKHVSDLKVVVYDLSKLTEERK